MKRRRESVVLRAVRVRYVAAPAPAFAAALDALKRIASRSTTNVPAQ